MTRYFEANYKNQLALKMFMVMVNVQRGEKIQFISGKKMCYLKHKSLLKQTPENFLSQKCRFLMWEGGGKKNQLLAAHNFTHLLKMYNLFHKKPLRYNSLKPVLT